MVRGITDQIDESNFRWQPHIRSEPEGGMSFSGPDSPS